MDNKIILKAEDLDGYLTDKDIKDLNIITLHLGSGASITAIKGGKCINTSMGLSPLGKIIGVSLTPLVVGAFGGLGLSLLE